MNKAPEKNRQDSPEDELDPNSQIFSQLRTLYDSVQDETIPDRFLDLLEKLDEAENAQQKAPAKDSPQDDGSDHKLGDV